MGKKLKFFVGAAHVVGRHGQHKLVLAAHSQKDAISLLRAHGVHETLSHLRAYYSNTATWLLKKGVEPSERVVYAAPKGNADWDNGDWEKLERIENRITVIPKYAGSSHDGRANLWRVTCPVCAHSFSPPSTRLNHQAFSCPTCGTEASADWNGEKVVFLRHD